MFFEGKNVLVTGGTGLVGRELCLLLEEAGAYVTSVSLDEFNFSSATPRINLRHEILDLRNYGNCREVCRNKDFIFHVAVIDRDWET